METGTPARQARGHERVEQILRATLEVVARDGVAAVTHRSVAEAAGVPLGSLTYYFSSKQELLRDALLLHVDEDTARISALASDLLACGAAGDQVVEAFAELLETVHGDIAQFELYIEAARDPELREAATQSLRAYERAAVLGLRAAGVPNPEGSAHIVVAAIDGLGIHRRASADGGPDLRASLATLLRALVAAG
ncbi:MAG: transcriptional regulator, TetR family [Solirubrobacterales bacterium]|jgi:DNA-binding transcriptional regulator YbjK|nr:transcriptional regulator, TetR family [Solirubrobacterales bacterium]